VWYLLQDPVGEARRLGRAGQYLEGADILQRYLESHPDRFDAQLLMGKLYWNLGNFEKARDHFDRAARLQPQDPDAVMLAAVAASKVTGTDARGRWSEILDYALQIDATDTEARYLLAALKGLSGDRQGQIREFEQIAGDPRFAVELATARALGGDIAGAQAALDRAPQEADALAVKAILQHLSGTGEDVLGLLQQAEGSSAPEAIATRLGLELLRTGDAEQALRKFQAAQQSGAGGAEAAYYYALCLQANGLDTEALQAFDRIVAGGGPYASEAAVQMALLFVQQGNLQQAKEQLRKAASGSGQSAKFYTVQGYIQMKEGAQNEAQQSFRMAIQNDPDYAPARLENGLLLVARGQLNDGVRDLEKFLALTAGAGNTAAREIELMVNQLKQTIAAPEEAAALPTARS
jgi:Tfp pilus assembly protein PilF